MRYRQMLLKGKQRALIPLLVFAAGITAGILLFKNIEFPDQRWCSAVNITGFSSFINYLLKSCKSTVVQASLIFISAFCTYKLSIFLPVFALRGLALGCSLFSFDRSAPYSVAYYISYIFITLLLLILAGNSISFDNSKKGTDTYNIASCLYTFLMINGAAIIIRTAPQILLSKMISL